ncbi:MAG TPA: hypothetical protein VJ724_10180, partial [Tahibacter sp.]|nr:hypothetical protein [Tahibacter sp.]
MTARRRLLCILVCGALAAANVHAAPQSQSFTYQGQLKHDGEPVTGTRNLTFALYDAATGGGQVGSTYVANAYPVLDGLFTIDLPFPDAFNGEQRWLEITVNGQPLVPRQPVAAAPVAQYALNGNPGATGATGPQGVAGPTGPQGVQGNLGPTGPQGVEGVQGPTGPQGTQGNLGPTGSQGTPGNVGATGPQGAQGNVGPTGPQGSVGPTGPQGAQGVQGAIGPTGPQGSQGVQGAIGPTGPQGTAGATGAQGPAGGSGIYGDGSSGTLNVTSGSTLDLTLTGGWNGFSGKSMQFTTITIAGTLIVPSGTVLHATGNVSVTGEIRVATGASDSGAGAPNPGISLAGPGQPNGGVGLPVSQASQLRRVPFAVGGASERAANT